MPLTKEMILTLQQVRGVGNKTIFRLADQADEPLGTVGQLYSYLKKINDRKIQAIADENIEYAHRIALNIISRCQREGVGIVSFYDEVYPTILKSCINEEGNLDPPIILYYRGNVKALKTPSVTVIGTREPTLSGILASNHFSGEFAKRGYNIVSGLAVGCDAAGHKGALSVGGITTAFLANGLDWASIYPQENLELAKDIVNKGGLLLSEYPVGTKCEKYGLVARDRLQAGLSRATIVIQAGERGGTMHVVNTIIKAGKPLFVVKYKRGKDDYSEKTRGNKKLIREGKAYPLSSDNLIEAVSIIERSFIGPKQDGQQGTLFENQ